MTRTALPNYHAEEVWPPFSEALLDWDESFHDLMLNDHIRMVAYRQAIFDVVKPGMRVLDLGTGTGILSQWALEAGAAYVYGIDLSDEILREAVTRMREAGFGDRFEPINRLSYDVQLDEPVDLLISEIMGNMADNEDFQPILQDAIQRLLKPGGITLPQATTSYLAPVAAEQAHRALSEGRIARFSPRYGIENMLQEKGIQSPFNMYYDTILPEALYLSPPQVLRAYSGAWDQPSVYSLDLNFECQNDGRLTGFKGFFIAQLSARTVLDISGGDIAKRETSDSWKHAYLPIQTPIEVRAGDHIRLQFARQYPRGSDRDAFRQIYRWRGEVTRNAPAGGKPTVIATFDQCMDESRLVASALKQPAMAQQ